MPETVRVAISEDLPKLTWPMRCPKCGETDNLVSGSARLGRVKSVRPNLGGVTMKSDILYLSYPVCEKHAGETRWATLLLNNSPALGAIRLILYVGALFALGFVLRPRAFIANFSLLSLYPLLGLLGVGAVIWTRKTLCIWPKRFDPDMDVVEIQFSDDEYATKFRLANREATSGRLTEAPPWYMRSLVWKVVVIAIFLLFMAKLMHR